jgi:hypothetical protein
LYEEAKYAGMKVIYTALAVGVLLATCSHGPLDESNDNVADAYVIAQETCYQDSSMNAWLLDCTVLPPFQRDQIGDTMMIDNVHYTNVIRIRNLDPVLQHIGLAVTVFFSNISEKKISEHCDVASPKVYLLREIVATHQGEAR